MFSYADQLIADNDLPKTTKITSIVEGFETAIFKQFFMHWNETENIIFHGRQYSYDAVSEFNIGDLHFEAQKRIAKSAGAAIGYVDCVSKVNFISVLLDSCLTMAQAPRRSGGSRTWNWWRSRRNRSTSSTTGTVT